MTFLQRISGLGAERKKITPKLKSKRLCTVLSNREGNHLPLALGLRFDLGGWLHSILASLKANWDGEEAKGIRFHGRLLLLHSRKWKTDTRSMCNKSFDSEGRQSMPGGEMHFLPSFLPSELPPVTIHK